MYAWGKKSKSVSFSRVYVCVKAKLTLVSFFFTFFSMQLSLREPVKYYLADLRRSIEKLLLIAGSELSVRLVVVGESEI